MNNEELQPSAWVPLKKALASQLNTEDYKTWIEPLRVHLSNGRVLVLRAPNRGFVKTLEQDLHSVFRAAVSTLPEPRPEVCFTDTGQADEEIFEILARLSPPTSPSQFNTNLNFNNFIVSKGSKLACAAAKAITTNGSTSYNPLFIYGPTGCGKTHLLHAIGQEFLATDRQLRVLYTSAKQFADELTEYEKRNDLPLFQATYRPLDVLLVDDAHAIAKGPKAHEEFEETLKYLTERNRRVVLASRRLPHRLIDAGAQLRSRLGGGLTATIRPPDSEAKVRMLLNMASAIKIKLPNEVAHRISENVQSDIRELEGIFNYVAASASLLDMPITIETVEDALRETAPAPSRVDTEEIIRFVAEHYGITIDEIRGKNTSPRVAFPRSIAMYLCKQLTSLSYPDIGKSFNNKHHTTVIHAVQKIDRKRKEDLELDTTIQEFIKHFG